MSINKTEPLLISNQQDSPYHGSLSFICGVSSIEDSSDADDKPDKKQADRELGQLQEDLLLLIGELEEFVLDEDQ